MIEKNIALKLSSAFMSEIKYPLVLLSSPYWIGLVIPVSWPETL